MLNPWYVTGFCDGEAAFTYSRAGGSFGLYFAVKQREDNRQIVEDIQEFFNFAEKSKKLLEVFNKTRYPLSSFESFKNFLQEYHISVKDPVLGLTSPDPKIRKLTSTYIQSKK